MPNQVKRLNLWRRKLVYFISVLHGAEHVYMNALSALYPFISLQLGFGYNELGMLTAVRSITSGLLYFKSGLISDWWGERRVLIMGFFISGVATFMFGLSTTLYILFFAQLLAGIGSSSFHPAGYSLVSQLGSKDNAGRRLGGPWDWRISWRSNSFSGAWCFRRLYRLQRSFLVISFLAFIAMLLVWKFLGSVNQLKEATYEEEAGKTSKKKTAFFKKMNVLLLICASISASVSQGLVVFLPTYFTLTFGVSVVEAGFYSSLMLGAGCVGLYIGGILADKLNRVYIVIIGSLISAVLIGLMGSPATGLLVSVSLIVVVGFAHYLCNPSQFYIIYSTSSKGYVGVIFGLTFGSSVISGALAILVLGWLADAYSIFFALRILAAVALLRAPVIYVHSFLLASEHDAE